MKKIYIILTKSGTVVSRLVHFITADTYTHVSIAFDAGLHTLYSSARKNGRTLFPAGPCTESLCSELFKRHPYTPCAVYELQVTDEIYEKAKQEVAQIMENADQYHYNIIGLLLCRFNIPCHRKHYFFCSQFVSEVLHRSQAVALPKDPSLMRPSDYMWLPELFCRFRGYLYELVTQEQPSFA